MKRPISSRCSAALQSPGRLLNVRVKLADCGVSAYFMTIAESDPEARLRRDALHRRLEELGWTDARGVRFDYRWPGPDPDRINTSARELVGLPPDVMLAYTPAGVVALQTIGKGLLCVPWRRPLSEPSGKRYPHPLSKDALDNI